MSITYREMQPEELDEALAFRNKIFSAVTREAWEREGRITVFVAYRGEELVGVLPLIWRDLRLDGTRAISTVFFHAVGVLSTCRGEGVGSGLLKCAEAEMAGKVDALCLYRSAERSAGYRFYAQNGYIDLHYARGLKLPLGAAVSESAAEVVAGTEAIFEAESELLVVFDSCYRNFGGFRKRESGFYEQALSGLIFNGHPQDLYLIRYAPEGKLLAYAVVGVAREAHDPAVVSILEMAAVDGVSEHCGPVLEAVAALAEKEQKPAFIFCSGSSPFFELLVERGFQPERRDFVVMARLLDPLGTARRLAGGDSLNGIEVWTPTVEGVLAEGASNTAKRVRLEMKDETLTRLICGRVQAESAVGMELISSPDGGVEDLAASFPFANWVYHGIDYI